MSSTHLPPHTHTRSHAHTSADNSLIWKDVGTLQLLHRLHTVVCTDTWTVKTPCCIHAFELAHRHMGGRGPHSWPSFNRGGQGHEVGVGWGPQEAEVSVAEPGSSWRGALRLEAPLSPHTLLISLTPAGEAFAGRWREGSLVTFGSPILSGPALLLAPSAGGQRLWPSLACPAVGLRVCCCYIKLRHQGDNGWSGYVGLWRLERSVMQRIELWTQPSPPALPCTGERGGAGPAPHCTAPTSRHATCCLLSHT